MHKRAAIKRTSDIINMLFFITPNSAINKCILCSDKSYDQSLSQVSEWKMMCDRSDAAVLF